MAFVSDRQRKAVMANINGGVKSDVNPRRIDTSSLPRFVKFGKKKGALIVDIVKTEDRFITTIKENNKESFITSTQPIESTIFKK